MILLRGGRPDDIDSIEKLVQVPGFINLSGDRDSLLGILKRSERSFKGEAKRKSQLKYVFVAEDLESKRIVGLSMLAAQHGTEDAPHFYFRVGTEQKFSSTINTGFLHGTLELMADTDGPSEVSSLVTDREFRNKEERVGRQLSYVRFLFLGMNLDKFRDKIIAEFLPPFNKRGQSPLWEALGRRFTNMDYWEADKLSQDNKEFIWSLFPTGKIYTTFCTAEARNSIGRLAKSAEPAARMLEKMGFKYRNEVDPFDGGPHFWANTRELKPVQEMKEFRLSSAEATGEKQEGLLSPAAAQGGDFRAVKARVQTDGAALIVSDSQQADQVRSVLALGEADSVIFMPFY